MQNLIPTPISMLYAFFWVIPRRLKTGNYPEESIQHSEHSESLKNLFQYPSYICCFFHNQAIAFISLITPSTNFGFEFLLQKCNCFPLLLLRKVHIYCSNSALSEQLIYITTTPMFYYVKFSR